MKKHQEAHFPARNEPCPCGSGKKYKRCCGVNAPPQWTTPIADPQDPSLSSLLEGPQGDPAFILQMTQALQKLPKSQIQRIQILMQKAKTGKDISKEAAQFEKTLPLDFQNLLHSMSNMFKEDENQKSTENKTLTSEQEENLSVESKNKKPWNFFSWKKR